MFGTILSISSSHWLGVWAGLEINLIGFLPVLVYQKRASERESAVKYFIVQALGSGLLIFGSLTGCSLSFTWEMLVTDPSFSFAVIMRGLVTKMGMFPFHFWLPRVIAGLPWFSCLMLATWQKLAPLLLITSLIEIVALYPFLLFVCLMASASSLVGGIGGINQTQVRAILAYSSIGHLGWIMFASSQRTWRVKTYFRIYVLISVTVFSTLWALDLANTKRIARLLSSSSFAAFALLTILLSLAGLPPMLGFISKWVVVYSSVIGPYWPFLFALLIGSLLRLFYYLSLYFSVFLGTTKGMFVGVQKMSSYQATINTGLALNLLGGTALIFLNVAREFYALIIFDKP